MSTVFYEFLHDFEQVWRDHNEYEQGDEQRSVRHASPQSMMKIIDEKTTAVTKKTGIEYSVIICFASLKCWLTTTHATMQIKPNKNPPAKLKKIMCIKAYRIVRLYVGLRDCQPLF